MEINFEKRYVLIYALIIAATHHIVNNINSIYSNVINNIWPIDTIILVFTLLLLSIFNRNQKQRIALGIIYKKSPFENAYKYIKKDNRISVDCEKIRNLVNISNKSFYAEYYKPVSDNKLVKSKNSEFCVIRDIVFTTFIILVTMTIFTIIWHDIFYKELIASIIAYFIGILACRMKAKDLVTQVIVENIYKGG